MSNNEHNEDQEDEQESELGFYHKFKKFVPRLFQNLADESTPKTVGESPFSPYFKDLTDKFEEGGLAKDFIKYIESSGSYDEKFMRSLTEKPYQIKSDLLESVDSKIIETQDLTEIISEEKNLKTLIETNQFLAKGNDELTKELTDLTKEYEKLTRETKDEIALLNNRIEELIKSKVSVSRTPSYWVDEVFSEEFERENVEE